MLNIERVNAAELPSVTGLEHYEAILHLRLVACLSNEYDWGYRGQVFHYFTKTKISTRHREYIVTLI